MRNIIPNNVAFTHDNRYILWITGDKFGMWNIKERRNEIVQSFGYIMCMALSSDGKYALVAIHGNSSPLWNIKTKKVEKLVSCNTAGYVIATGKNLFYIYQLYGGHLCTYNLEKNEILALDSGSNYPNAAPVAVTIHGDFFVFSNNCGLNWLSTYAPNTVFQFPGHFGAIDKVIFTCDGAYVASRAVNNRVRIWNLRTKKEEDVLHSDALEQPYLNGNALQWITQYKEIRSLFEPMPES